MFLFRFPKEDIADKTLNELMGMEGKRVKAIYEEYAVKYHVDWQGRKYILGKFQMSDITNKILTAANTDLYSVIHLILDLFIQEVFYLLFMILLIYIKKK